MLSRCIALPPGRLARYARPHRQERRSTAQGPRALCSLHASGGRGRQRGGVDLKGVSEVKLHIYDHCPYCTRVELVLGWRGLRYDRAVYGYADVEGPTALTGKKVLPVLEWTDLLGEQRRMRESVDIIRAVDSMDGPDNCIMSPKAGRKDLNSWQNRLRKVMHRLTRPRLLRMPIADFATPEDVQYQKSKYIERGFDYEKSLASTAELLPRVEALLAEFETLMHGSASLNGKSWSWDDLHTLPSLRVLTCVADLQWPAKTLRYVEEAHARAGVSLYFEHAC